MPEYEYTVEIEGKETSGHQKKELVIDASKYGVRIMPKGEESAIVAFTHNGEIRIYKSTARKAGFTPWSQ